MGHERLSVTDKLYGKLAGDSVKEIVTGLSHKSIEKSNQELFNEFLAYQKWREQNYKSSSLFASFISGNSFLFSILSIVIRE